MLVQCILGVCEGVNRTGKEADVSELRRAVPTVCYGLCSWSPWGDQGPPATEGGFTGFSCLQ